jgi:hypothetical protein
MIKAANAGFFGKMRRRFEDAGFLKVGLDVLFHEGNGTLTSGSGVLNEKFIGAEKLGRAHGTRVFLERDARDSGPAVRALSCHPFSPHRWSAA